MSTPLLEYAHVTMRYHAPSGEIPVLEDFSLKVDPGEFIALIGPSGCGKSTLLSLAAGLLSSDEGQVLLHGEPIRRPPRHMGYMLQKDQLFSWLTIRENARIGLRVRKEETHENLARVDDLLKSTGLWEFRDRIPRQLSGGMRQRAALVRTLAVQPDFLLLDEPFSALDSQTRVKIADEVGGIIRQQGCCALLVTHDLSEAIAMAGRVVVLSRRPARIKAEHRIEMAGSPLERRKDPQFKEYFDILWKELDVHVD